MKHFSHLNTATRLILQYEGGEPLHLFLKKFFSQHKKFGSKDRKRISHLCYVFYRVGSAVRAGFPHKEEEMIQQIIVAGLFLCSHEPDELLEMMKPAWNSKTRLPVSEKADIINKDGAINPIDLHNIFPLINELSERMDSEAFNLSHLQQPSPFIRIRPGYLEMVMHKLGEQGIHYKFIPPSAVRLPNGVKVDDIFEVDKEVVVQDLNSQRIGEFLRFGFPSQRTISVWDCCAASGGKSLMAKDILVDIDLTVSDIRESILANLKKRFAIAGINTYKSILADLSKPLASVNPNPSKDNIHHSPLTIHHSFFDLIIADFPCTGSGTWGRTPEQLYFFDPSMIEKYSGLQKKIVTNIIPHLKESGKLLYVTCSVFEKENEDNVRFILEHFPLKVERMELLNGYNTQADTMFAALLSHL